MDNFLLNKTLANTSLILENMSEQLTKPIQENGENKFRLLEYYANHLAIHGYALKSMVEELESEVKVEKRATKKFWCKVSVNYISSSITTSFPSWEVPQTPPRNGTKKAYAMAIRAESREDALLEIYKLFPTSYPHVDFIIEQNDDWTPFNEAYPRRPEMVWYD